MLMMALSENNSENEELLSYQVTRNKPKAEFNEFERRFKFKPRLKYGWYQLYQMFQDLSRR